MKSKCIIITLLVLVSFSSCVSSKKLIYLKYADETYDAGSTNKYARTSVTPSDYKIMPNDNLFIRVITPDPQWSQIFNATTVGQGGAMTEESASLAGYPVQADGKIEIPYIGGVAVANRTLSEIKIKLDSIFKNYVSDAGITVRLVGNYISILGEVNAPGRYLLTKDRINVFEALSLAGDMNVYGNRKKVKLIRQTPYGPIVKEFSLSDRSIFMSDYYYLMPNDIIYAVPTKGKVFQANFAVWSLFLTAITSALGVIAFFRTL